MRGRYRVNAMAGACGVDLALGPSQEADVVVTPDGAGGCTLVVAALHGFDDPRPDHEQPGELIAPGSLPTEEPAPTD